MFLKSGKRVFVDDAALWNVETEANIPGFLQRLVLQSLLLATPPQRRRRTRLS